MGAPGGKGSVLFLTWVAATQVVTLEFYVDAEDVFLNLELPWEVVTNRSAEVKDEGCGPSAWVL